MEERDETSIETFDISNHKLIKCLIKLSFIDGKQMYNKKEIEKYLGYNKVQPDIRLLLQFLISNEIIFLHKTILNINFYKINIRRLRDFIDELTCTNEWYKYFYQHHIIQW